MGQLATNLMPFVDRKVIDRTGLAGTFDFDLQWASDQVLGGHLGAIPGRPGPPPVALNAPSLFTAVHEQLGLKLDPQQGPVEVLVIDRVARPSEN